MSHGAYAPTALASGDQALNRKVKAAKDATPDVMPAKMTMYGPLSCSVRARPNASAISGAPRSSRNRSMNLARIHGVRSGRFEAPALRIRGEVHARVAEFARERCSLPADVVLGREELDDLPGQRDRCGEALWGLVLVVAALDLLEKLDEPPCLPACYDEVRREPPQPEVVVASRRGRLEIRDEVHCHASPTRRIRSPSISGFGVCTRASAFSACCRPSSLKR